MLSRSMPWRRACPEVVKGKADEALQATIYILMQTGPTGFVLKEEGTIKKVKVFLGDPHMCSCTAFKKHHELCVHILWLLLKKFRIPQENPIIWQLGLVEREINEILHGYLKRQTPETTVTSSKSRGHSVVKRKDIGLEDVCPICQDELLGTTQILTYCKFGCGNSVHNKCMKIWADHQKSTGEVTVRCPLCREDFGPLKEMPLESSRRLRAVKASVHLGVACTHCHVCPISGKCYKCTRCASYHLCHACFSSNQVHVLHSFEYRHHCNQPWRLAERPMVPSVPPSDSPVLPPALINSLQSRSLTENDYELLLQLEGSSSSSLHSTHSSWRGGGSSESEHVPEGVINSFHVEPLHGNHPLIMGHDECHVCGGVYSRGDWVRKLPCKHKFHRECIDEWLHSNHTTCPIDGQPVYVPQVNRQQRQKKRLLTRQNQSDHGSTRNRVIGPLTKAAMSSHHHTSNGRGGEGEQAGIVVSGQGIGGSQKHSASCNRERNRLQSSPLHLQGDSSQPLKPLQAYVLLRNSRIRQARPIPPPSHTDDTPTNQHHTHSNNSSSTSGTVLPKISNASMCGHLGQGSGSGRGLSTKRRLTVSIPTADNKDDASFVSQSNTTVMDSKDNDVLLAPVCSGYVPVISHRSPAHQHVSHLQGDVHTPDLITSPIEGSMALPMVHFLYDIKTNDGSRSPSSAGRLKKGSLVSGSSGNEISTDSSNTVLNSSLRVSSFKLCPLPPTTSIVAATTL